MADARTEMLARIRSGLRGVPQSERAEDVAVLRDYRTQSERSHEELVDQFAERVAEYKATVQRVAADMVLPTIAKSCAARNVQRLVVSADLPAEWVIPGVELLRDDGLSYTQLDAVDGVLTGCALGIAETGTIALDGGPLQGRRVITLLPDYHLCIIRAEQVVGSVPEAITALAGAVRDDRRPITMISGPSATSDIELNRVEGVHGPRVLEVVILDA